jgi:hypothetical protein
MKQLHALIIIGLWGCNTFAQLPTDTSMKQRKDSIRKDTAKLKGGAIIDTIRPIDTIHRKVEQMRPKTKDDLKDTVPQKRR